MTKNTRTEILIIGASLAFFLLFAVLIVCIVPGETAIGAPDTQCVTITTTDAAFSPSVELVPGSGATVAWLVAESGASYSDTSPAISFGSAGTHHVRLTAVGHDGLDALGDIVTFNIGFNHEDDAGYFNVGSGYDRAPQGVSALEGITCMTGLLRFLAATPTLRGAADFSGLSRLEYIECYGAKLSSVNLQGCGSLIRLCVEKNDLDSIDLNPVSSTLRDLRLSGNRSAVTIAPLSSPLLRLYHYCAQSISIAGHPTAAQLPAVVELWDWKSGQSGPLVIRSGGIQSVLTYGNAWTSLDIAEQFPSGRDGHVDAHGCRLSSVDLTGDGGLTYLDLHDNALGISAVDGILRVAASWGTSGGTLNLSGNEAPSEAGLGNISILTGRGWTVSVDTAPPWNNPYHDVPGDVWYAGAVRYVSERGLMTGADGAFEPAAVVTRAMFVTILLRLSGEDGSDTVSFSDVPGGSWYGAAVGWASARGIVSGVGGNRFAPEAPISREQLAVLLYRYAGYKGCDVSVGQDTNILSYNDAPRIGEYAIPALQWACGAGIIGGDQAGNLRPTDGAVRAEIAAMLQRFEEKYPAR